MKFTHTDFKKQVNICSSYIVYITRSNETAHAIHNLELTKLDMMKAAGWYYHISTVEVCRDCRVPEFFHENGYWATIIEHNNGDWDKTPTYELFIAE